jgi:antitoxin component of MazEF toxin-antitoxin module
MIKYLTTHGNSLALVIEKGVLDLLRITSNTPLEINTDGRNLIISPQENEGQEGKVRTALAKVNKRHSKTLKALAG